MATQTTTTTEADQIQKLRNTVNLVDCLAQGGFSQISAIARLALAQLEHPDGYRHPELIAEALNAIWYKAEEVENCINSQAEMVGCNYVDEAQRRRWAAAKQTQGAAA